MTLLRSSSVVLGRRLGLSNQARVFKDPISVLRTIHLDFLILWRIGSLFEYRQNRRKPLQQLLGKQWTHLSCFVTDKATH